MLFTTKHAMYQVKESVFVTYMYAGIFHLPPVLKCRECYPFIDVSDKLADNVVLQ